MPTGERSKLQYEGGQTSVPMSALTDTGDRDTFVGTQQFWSKRGGFAPVIRPDGLLTGGAITPDTTISDQFDVSALTAWLGGDVKTLSAQTGQSITRPATDVARVISVTLTSAGALALVNGTDGSDQNFVEARGADGGPPYIPVGSIELGQIRVAVAASDIIAESEIFSVIGLHVERADYPLWEVDYGRGVVNAGIMFTEPLDAIHVGDLPKGIYASYAGPIFSDVPKATDFVPPENSHAVASTQIYGRAIGATNTTLNAGSFTAFLENGVNDPLVRLVDEFLWFRFYPDRLQTSVYIVSQGKLGLARTFPAGDQFQAACTIASEDRAVEVG